MLAPPVGMCRLSQDQMENMNADQIDISLMHKTGTNNGSSCKASGDDQINGQREMNKKNYKHSTQEEEDQLPEELENVLHLSTSSASDDATSSAAAANQQTHSNNSTAAGSLTSSPQSTIEHTQTNTHTNIQHHQAPNHVDLDPDDDHPHHHDQNIMHANSEASLNDSCNSSTNMFSNLLLNGGGCTPIDVECGSAPFVLSSTTRSLWLGTSSSSNIEEPTSFFSSSIVNESLTPDLSLMSSTTSLPKSTPTLPAATEATHDNDHRTLPFFNESNHNMHLMEDAASFHHHNASLMMSDSVEYPHFHRSNIPSYSSFLAESPSSCLPSERGYHHVNFLGTGTGDANGATGHECTASSMFHHQMHNYNLQQHTGEVDHAASLSYHPQQEGILTEGAYACYLGPPAQGMIPVMPMHGGTHTSNYMLNAMELQQAAEQYYHGHHHEQGEGHHHHLTHSHSLPLSLDQFGSTQQTSLMESQRIEIAALNGAEAGGGGVEDVRSQALMTPASISSYRGAVRSRVTRKSKELASSGSTAMEVGEDDGSWAHAEGHITANAASWRASNHVVKGMTRHPNKRPSPEGEEEESLHESAPPLKRSVSWDCIGLMNNSSKQPMSRSNSSPLGCGIAIDHLHMMNMQLSNTVGSAAPFSMNLTTNPAPLHQNTKQDKPRVRQGIANDPQSIAARHRRERISERLKILQQLIPNGSKVDLVTMLEKAINYVKFLQLQVKVLATDEYWPTPLNKFPKVATMAKLATHSKEPTDLEKVEKALVDTIQANS
ncbi:hypothetical protein GOP47_0022890 [Adiantum capillus-veneris]|uniref:BHLH domain-containing protein n=1 Tax=Adiantum capillus-veneris TaxID=13818 RepID=A0A9D4Z7B0_ADICA|nr:hypothetical protein GOP47_0022890 [Adiantum capillus-veneris]